QFNHVHDQRTTGHSTANQVEVVVKLLESEAMIRVQSTEVNHPACKLMDALRSLNLKVHYASVSCVKDLMLQDVIVKVHYATVFCVKDLIFQDVIVKVLNGFTSDQYTLRLVILNKMVLPFLGFSTIAKVLLTLCNEGGGGEKCVKEKQHTSTNDATKDIVVVSPPAVDEPVVDTGNTKDVNAGRTSIDSTVDPNSETLGVNMDWLSECLTRLPGCSSSSLALWMGRSSFARAMIELRADVELKDTIVVAMPKLVAEGNSNPFDVLNSVENDVDLGTNRGTSNLASKEVNSSGSSFWNVRSSCVSTTPIVEKIDKLKKLIIDGKIKLVDDEGKPLKKIDYPGDHDSKN
nr:hypothetical protein [Tanacetum cinerariifolium]